MANIIIAEDDRSICSLLKVVLKNMGHTPFFCPNGRHAWETLESNNEFDLMICDFQMPEMNGRELIVKMRENATMQKLPVIMISAVVGPKAIADLLDAGVTLFMPKPLDIATLQEYVRRCVDQEAEILL